MKLLNFLWVVLAVGGGADGQSCKNANTAKSTLKKEVLAGYNKSVIPKKLQNATTAVTVQMILKYFTYNMHESTLSVHSWLNMFWVDETIRWNPSENSNISFLHVRSDDIWHPDLSVYNGADLSGSQSVFNSVDCLVSSNGVVACVTPTRDDALCSPFLRKYPFDVQNCTVKYGSWVHSGEVLDFHMGEQPVKLEDFEGTGEWSLTKVIALKNLGNYSCCPNNTYPSLNYYFFIQRHSGSLVCMVIVPAIAMLLISLVSLCLSPEESGRLCIISTNSIIHLIFIQYVSWQLPVSGPETPLILVYAKDSLFLCVYSLVLTVGQRRLTRAKTLCPDWMNKALVWIVSNPVGRYLFMFDEVYKYVEYEDTNKLIEESGTSEGTSLDWMTVSRILDRICFVVYLGIYSSMIIIFLS